MSDVKQELVESEAQKAVALQRSLIQATQELKVAQANVDEAWKHVETLMLENNIKSIKNDEWGSITIAEKPTFIIDKELLPPRYWKKVPNDAKIRSEFTLENVLPKGVEVVTKKYLTKRLKGLAE